jgi:hypothetical protein
MPQEIMEQIICVILPQHQPRHLDDIMDILDQSPAAQGELTTNVLFTY